MHWFVTFSESQFHHLKLEIINGVMFLYPYFKGLLHGKISHTLMLCKQFITLKYVNHFIK